MNNNIKKAYQERPKTLLRNVIISLVLLVILYWATTSINFKGLDSKGTEIAKNIFRAIFNPDTELLFEVEEIGVPFLLLETMSIALLGTIIGSILAIPMAFLASRNIMPKPISAAAMFVIAAIRTFPALVYGLMFIRVTGPGPFAGVLTLSVTSIGMVSKLYIEAIEDLDRGILESLDAAGCNTLEKVRYGILPQLMTNFLSTTIYRFEINVKNASILGLVGAGGIGAPLLFAMSAYRWSEVGSILIGLVALVLVIEQASTKIRVKLARG
jgi:phosphonate transport system permease protein